MARYPAPKVKLLNERMRKLESVYTTPSGKSYAESGKSYFYTQARNAYIGGGDISKFYNPKTTSVNLKTGKSKIRFLTQKQFEALPETAQQEFNKMIAHAVNAPTTTKSGILLTEKKAQEAFKNRYYDQMKFIPESEQDEAVTRMRESINQFFADKKDHFVYNKDTWDLLASNFDFEKFFVSNRDRNETTWENIFLQAFNYAANHEWTKIPKRYILNNH